MIKLKNVSKSYGNIQALNNISMCISKGEIVGLVGANGAGKTSIIRVLTNQMQPDNGVYFLNGVALNKLHDRLVKIAYIPDEPIYYESMTVKEHLEFITSLYPKSIYKISDLVQRFELEDHLDKIPHALSKGNKQKLTICMALVRDFEFIFADEPFTGLDPVQLKVLKMTFSELKERGYGVLISTHLLDVIELVCDRYIFIHKGRIIASGSKYNSHR